MKTLDLLVDDIRRAHEKMKTENIPDEKLEEAIELLQLGFHYMESIEERLTLQAWGEKCQMQ